MAGEPLSFRDDDKPPKAPTWKPGLLVSTVRRLKMEPFPSWFHGIIRGMRVHGSWLDTRSTSANTGRRLRLASSSRCRAPITYWSGIDANANDGPRYPTAY